MVCSSAGAGNFELRGQFGDRVTFDQIAIGQERTDIARSHPHHAQAIFLQAHGVGDDETRDRRHGAMALEHRAPEQMVGGGFIDEAPALLVDAHRAGLAAVHHEMREHRHAAVGAPANGNRRPESIVLIAFAKPRAQRQREILHLAGAARRRRTEIRRGLMQHLGAAASGGDCNRRPRARRHWPTRRA